jgi:hypothetical protein
VGHYLAWIWLVRQGWLIIPVIDGIGANPVVQVHNATLIGRRERCVGGPEYRVRIPEGDRLVCVRENRRVISGVVGAHGQADGARAHDRAN